MTETASPPLIRVEQLSKTYTSDSFTSTGGVRTAAHDVSFDIFRGETFGLVGRSGSGKTTIGRSILRLIEPTSGRVTVRAEPDEPVDLMALAPRELRRFRRHLQMVFQDPYATLNPRLTVRQVVEEPLRVHHVVEPSDVADRAREIIDLVGLGPELIDERPTAFSGGQRQRVGSARAITTNPRFIVADEPVTALDVSVQAQILNLLKDLQDRMGLSYLFISHDMAVVEHMADRIGVTADGRLVEVGLAAEVLANPQHFETRSLVDSARARQGIVL